MKHWFVLAVAIIGLFLVATCKTAASEDAPTPTVPMIRGTISFMFDDDTIESITSDNLFMTQEECYEKGRAAVQEFLPQLPSVIGHLIVCQPVGDNI